METTGCGISATIQDNEHTILVADCANQIVFLIDENQLIEGRIPIGAIAMYEKTLEL